MQTSATDIYGIISHSQNMTEAAMRQLLQTFRFVPDDKLHWSPTDTCKPALKIVAHCACANTVLARAIATDWKEGPTSIDEGAEITRQYEADVTHRDQAARLLEESVAQVIRSLSAITPARYAQVLTTPFGAQPMSFWMMLPSLHMGNHAAQIDYLQTIWGDLKVHA